MILLSAGVAFLNTGHERVNNPKYSQLLTKVK